MRRAREDVARRLERGVDLAPELREVERERPRPRLLARQQCLGMQAIRELGRDAAGRRMRVGQQPARLEFRELVPDRRRGDLQACALDQVVRADRLAGGDVLLDHAREDLALARGQADYGITCHLQPV